MLGLCGSVNSWKIPSLPAGLYWCVPGRRSFLSPSSLSCDAGAVGIASRLMSSGLRVPFPSALLREQAADPGLPDPNTSWCFFFSKKLNLCICGQSENGRTKGRESASSALYPWLIARRPLSIYRKFQLPTLLWTFLHEHIGNTCSAYRKTWVLGFFLSAEKAFLMIECFFLFYTKLYLTPYSYTFYGYSPTAQDTEKMKLKHMKWSALFI